MASGSNAEWSLRCFWIGMVWGLPMFPSEGLFENDLIKRNPRGEFQPVCVKFTNGIRPRPAPAGP